MFVNRTHGVVAATLGVLGLGLAGCDDPTQSTDLRSEGPPDVLAVLVLTDAVSGLYETATYCRPNDEKRPSQVGLPDFTTQQVCPASLSEAADEVVDAYPDGWYVRIMFDELLDPNVEELTEIIDADTGEPTDTYTGSIANTKPVTLRCQNLAGTMVNVDYDGYYSPSGNRITWPLGPSLVIKPNDPTLIATNTACEITINDNVTDKGGTPVDSAQRGPYTFKIAPISVLAIDPADDEDGASPVSGTQIWFDNVYVQFNTLVDEASFCDEGTAMDECEFGFSPDTAGAYGYSLAPYGFTPAEYGFGPNEPVETEKAYTFSFTGGAKIADRCGKPTTFGTPSAGDQTLIHFTTDKFKYSTATIATGETSSAMKKLKLTFSNVLDAAETPGAAITATAVPPTGWTLDPMPFDTNGTTQLTNATAAVSGPDASGQFFVKGHYKLDQQYTFTLKAGTVVTDWHGATYTQASDLVIQWKTQPTLAITSATADHAVITKAAPTSSAGVSFGFNQAMVASSLAADDFTIVNSSGAAVTMDATVASGCATTSTSCTLLVRKAGLTPGDYKFTLKAGATITDVFGNNYTQAADRIINFTVQEAAPAGTCL